MRRRNEQFERAFEREQTLNTLLAQKVGRSERAPSAYATSRDSCMRAPVRPMTD